jgi:hypothetical protein
MRQWSSTDPSLLIMSLTSTSSFFFPSLSLAKEQSKRSRNGDKTLHQRERFLTWGQASLAGEALVAGLAPSDLVLR